MKKIIYNESNISEDKIGNIIKRAKVVVENSNGELLFVKTIDNMFLLGGHVEKDESDNNTLIREIKEEAGIDINPNVGIPDVEIKYLCKNYPVKGVNTMYLSNYYFIKSDEYVVNESNLNLTDEEYYSGFHLVYIDKYNALAELEKVLKISKRPNVVRDTMSVIENYLDVTK